jgi:hypothetical protein
MFLDEAMNLDLDEVSKPTDFIHMSPIMCWARPRPPTVAICWRLARMSLMLAAYDAVYTIMDLGRESSPSPVSAFLTLDVAAQQAPDKHRFGPHGSQLQAA